MASKYGVDKSQLLDSQAKQSLGVRLALGETEVVNETRDFLISNGVSLDSFSQVRKDNSHYWLVKPCEQRWCYNLRRLKINV